MTDRSSQAQKQQSGDTQHLESSLLYNEPEDTMTRRMLLLLLAYLQGCSSGEVGREMRATRMSVVDFWKNETLGDGLNVRVAHGVNSWPDLVDQLHEPFLNKSMMIEGDVFLLPQRRPKQRAIPVMRAETRLADRITFKEWLREVATLHKAIKINFRSTEVVHPVLHQLYAAEADPTSPILQYPVILHANVFRSIRSLETPVDPATFVEKTQSLFPDATLSLGWTKQNNFSHLHPKYKRLTWQDLFHILEYVVHLDQPVMLSVRLAVAAHSKDQLLWLLGMDRQVSLLIWSDEEDTVTDWQPVIELRQKATKNRVVYDLNIKHRQILQNITNEPVENPPAFSLSEWRAVEFPSPSTMLSTVVRSENGPAFLGRPAALLLSQKPPPEFPSSQLIEGVVHFLPKRSVRDLNIEDKSGLVIYLLDKVQEIESPEINKALQVYIGHDGRISIENRQDGVNYYEAKSSGQLGNSECYGFKVMDKGWRVIAEVWTQLCGDRKSRKKREVTTLTLDTPYDKKNRNLRTVVISKTGDGAIDFLLEKLHHNSGSLSTTSLILSFFLLLFFY